MDWTDSPAAPSRVSRLTDALRSDQARDRFLRLSLFALGGVGSGLIALLLTRFP